MAHVVRETVTILAMGVMRSPTVDDCAVSVASALTKSRSLMMPTSSPLAPLRTIRAPTRFFQNMSAHCWTVEVSST